MKSLKTKVALVAAAVSFVSAASAAELTIQPTLEVSNALTLTQVAGTALNFGRIRAQTDDTTDDCRTLYIPANTTNQPTTTKPANIGGANGTALTALCTAVADSSLAILSPLADLTVVSFEVSDAAPFTALDITIDHSADISSPDPSAASFTVPFIDVYRTTTPAAAVAMTPSARVSTGNISTGPLGTVAFNLGALIATEVSTDDYIDASYTGSIVVTVDY